MNIPSNLAGLAAEVRERHSHVAPSVSKSRLESEHQTFSAILNPLLPGVKVSTRHCQPTTGLRKQSMCLSQAAVHHAYTCKLCAGPKFPASSQITQQFSCSCCRTSRRDSNHCGALPRLAQHLQERLPCGFFTWTRADSSSFRHRFCAQRWGTLLGAFPPFTDRKVVS